MFTIIALEKPMPENTDSIAIAFDAKDGYKRSRNSACELMVSSFSFFSFVLPFYNISDACIFWGQLDA